MDQNVIKILEQRINELKKVATPDNIEQGMSGSFLWFQMYLETAKCMSEEEFYDEVYDDWLREKHDKLLEYVHRTE